MLYLNSVENAAASKTEKKYAICHEKIPAMQNITELAPSKELFAQWESKEISWEAFRVQFIDEMRKEYRKKESQLKKLIQYSLENDVTLHSPEPKCEFFSPTQLGNRSRTCQHCDHLDQQVYICPRTNRVVIHYEWTTSIHGTDSQSFLVH